jgi:hypothetical protein
VTTVPTDLTKSWWTRFGSVALLVLIAGCGGNDSAGCAEPKPVSQNDLARVPADLDLTDYGTVTRIDTQASQTSYRVEGKGSVDEAYVPVTRQLRRDGWDLVGTENEGVDAEVFIARGTKATGVLRLKELRCAGGLAIEVTVNRPTTEG